MMCLKSGLARCAPQAANNEQLKASVAVQKAPNCSRELEMMGQGRYAATGL